jgi:hypothetical protein
LGRKWVQDLWVVMRQNPFPQCLAASSLPIILPTSVLHVLDIVCPVGRLRDFMSDMQQWLPWALPTLESMHPLPFGQWLLKTPRQILKLRLCPSLTAAQNEQHYELVVPAVGSCQVLMRTVATAAGCRLAITFCKHHLLSPLVFQAGVRRTISGLETLKQLLEQD